MKEKTLKNLSYLYILLPIIIFAVGWIKPIIAFPIAFLLILAYIKICINNKDNTENVMEKKHVCLIYVFCIILCITAGLGNLFYQSPDWDIRNAICRDLVNKDWPVTYENTYMLTYYIGFWLVPSLAGKVVNFFGEIINQVILGNSNYMIDGISEIAFGVSNIAVLFWGALGVLLTCIWLIKLLKLEDRKKYWKAIAIFFIFSGLDILGAVFNLQVIANLHLDQWAGIFQFSSMITQIFWVFNQAIPIWLITLLFYSEKKIDNYVVIIVSALAYSPFGAVGLAPLLICNGVINLVKSIKNKEIKTFIKEVFSMQNIIFLIGILPIYCSYYLGNSAVSETGSSSNYTIFNTFGDMFYSYEIIILLIFFYFIEVGIYILILYKDNKKNILFYVVAIALAIIPIFVIGKEIDFCMRVSIPSLVLLDFWTVKFLLETKNKISIRYILMVLIFIIGSYTPLTEYYRAFYCIASAKKINLVYDETKTIVKDGESAGINFVTENYQENSLFYKYFAKK